MSSGSPLPRKTTSGPSDKAVEAIAAQGVDEYPGHAQATAEAVYPVIRGDVIAEVAEVLRTMCLLPAAADFIERECGGQR